MSGTLVDILQRLAEAQVDFVIIGGFAAVTHGSTMVTQDIDICCDFSAPSLERIRRALEDLHPVHRLTPNRLPFRLDPESSKTIKNLYLDTDFGVLDCLSSVLGLGNFEKVREASVAIEWIKGYTLRVLSIDALIIAKQAMGRPKDKETVIQLQAIRYKQNAN